MSGPRALTSATIAVVVVLIITACASVPPLDVARPRVQPKPILAPATPVSSGVIAQSDRFVLYAPAANDTLAALARRFLGSEDREWEIAKFNGVKRAEAGRILAIPLEPINPGGIMANGFQTVPILCYHRFGPQASKMVVSPETFALQLDYLARQGYRVIRLSQVSEFLLGKRALPDRSVVITLDDGHISTYQYAYPLLKKHGFPATFFLYSDFIGSGDALRWTQIKEMAASGLIDFQAHSKTHSNLMVRLQGESEQQYRDRLDTEIRVPQEVLQRNLSAKVTHYAYPYGDANEAVLERLAAASFSLGVTVNPGGNAFFAQPMMLRRTMVFGDYDIAGFNSLLQVFKEIDLR
jgi:peptidoglycan/xylan/chitin deacetylase (PgdA/CDA1 family)